MSDALERRKEDQRVRKLIDDVAALKGDIAVNAAAMADLKIDVQANTDMTRRIHDSTAGMVEMFNDMRGGFRLFNKLMSAVRWFLRKALFPLVFIAGASYAITHGGRLPEWIKLWFDLFR